MSCLSSALQQDGGQGHKQDQHKQCEPYIKELSLSNESAPKQYLLTASHVRSCREASADAALP